jgi:hypothetical protein
MWYTIFSHSFLCRIWIVALTHIIYRTFINVFTGHSLKQCLVTQPNKQFLLPDFKHSCRPVSSPAILPMQANSDIGPVILRRATTLSFYSLFPSHHLYIMLALYNLAFCIHTITHANLSLGLHSQISLLHCIIMLNHIHQKCKVHINTSSFLVIINVQRTNTTIKTENTNNMEHWWRKNCIRYSKITVLHNSTRVIFKFYSIDLFLSWKSAWLGMYFKSELKSRSVLLIFWVVITLFNRQVMF